MANSMTGFGRSAAEEDGQEFTIEIKTLNHRYLDINIRLPRVLSFIEEDIRNTIQDNLKRGRVEVNIFLNSANSRDRLEVQLNRPLLESYLKSFGELSKDYGLEGGFDLSTLVKLEDIFLLVEEEQDEDKIKNLILSALIKSLDNVKIMRANEGLKLAQDIEERCNIIIEKLNTIEERSPIIIEEYRERLRDRLAELLNLNEYDEAKLNSEIVFLADRSNITEEIVRLKSHLLQMNSFLKEEDSIGRKLDFLVQEMNREVNTIGSKSNDLIITNLVVEIKSEIEKIREQVQNIE